MLIGNAKVHATSKIRGRKMEKEEAQCSCRNTLMVTSHASAMAVRIGGRRRNTERGRNSAFLRVPQWQHPPSYTPAIFACLYMTTAKISTYRLFYRKVIVLNEFVIIYACEYDTFMSHCSLPCRPIRSTISLVFPLVEILYISFQQYGEECIDSGGDSFDRVAVPGQRAGDKHRYWRRRSGCIVSYQDNEEAEVAL